MCKLLALAADCVMVGSALAGTHEAFLRAARFAGEDPEYIEGADSIVPYKGHVTDVLQRYLAGLRSSMSYMDARTIDEYGSNASFLRTH